jgi:molybdopterin molybdotransferase
MLTFEEAYADMMAAAVTLKTEAVDFVDAVNRVLAQDVRADMPMPPFNKSAMDGYACRRADLGEPMTVIEEIPAGCMPCKSIGASQCAKIMTGAPVPQGADCVIMVEYTEPLDADQIRFTADDSADNICLKGEDISEGDVVLSKGERITPAHIAVLATVGCTRPQVYAQPRVAILATGSELVEPTCKADGARIRNSNSDQLAAQLRQMGVIVNRCGIIPDSLEATVAAIDAARRDHDLVMLSGGVSMGDYDFVPEALQKSGFEFCFESVAMQPGRPTIFGRCGETYCFGLPGNPVSTFIIVEIMVKPFLLSLMGGTPRPVMVEVTLDKAIRRRKAKRQSTIPMALTTPGNAVAVEYHGSAHINALCRADALLTIPIGITEMPQGSKVNVRLI